MKKKLDEPVQYKPVLVNKIVHETTFLVMTLLKNSRIRLPGSSSLGLYLDSVTFQSANASDTNKL